MDYKKRILATIVSFALIFAVMPGQSVKADGVEESSAVEIESLEETAPVEEDNLTIQYLYVKTPYLVTPDTQEILVSFNEGVSITDAVLVYRNDNTGEAFEVTASEIKGSSVIFHMNFEDELQSGIYQLTEVKVTKEGTEFCINLQNNGIDSRFGVNQECDTDPDAIVEDEDTLSVAEEAGVEVSFMTLSDAGEVAETSSAEDALMVAGVEVQESSEQMQVQSRTVAYSTNSGNVIIVLDPGHGGFDSGAVGNGAKEKDLTLKIAKYCKEELEKYNGVTVYMTRTADQTVGGINNSTESLKARVAFAAEKQADVLVSIHLNSTGKGTAYGAEVYFPNSSYNSAIGSQGMKLAQDIQNELVSLGLEDRGIKIRNSENGSTYPDGSVQDYYSLIWRSKKAGFPAIIVEHAFIDNADDYNKYLNSDAKLKKLGQADATGIANYFGLTEGEWKQDDNGWKFQYKDGTSPVSCWRYISGAWYYFDASGYRVTDFHTIGESKYYFAENGKMLTGWQLLDDKWYYFVSSGEMVRNTWVGNYYVDSSGVWDQENSKAHWIQVGDRWWYQHVGGGYTVSNWELIDGSWYYFDQSGWMVTGWKLLGNIWYYLKTNGKMAVGLKEIDGSTYYFNNSGAMATGWQKISENWYYFMPSGAMAKDTWIGKYYVDSSGIWRQNTSRWIQSGGRWWYCHGDGSYTVSNWELIDGNWYYFDKAGWMVTGWQLVGSTWYYLSDNGVMCTGYKQINGEWYFFNNKQAPLGMLTYTGVTPIMGKSELGNDKSTIVSKLVMMYSKRGRVYPSEVFGQGGAADIQRFCEILYEESVTENVKPEVVFGQAMKETGYLQYGGDVKPEQYNFAGLGATGNGVSGASFVDVREGLRAQVQHLKAYASDEALKQGCVDPRFQYVTRKSAPYVEWLGISENPDGKGWAAAIGYGLSLMKDYINPIMAL